MPRTSVSDILKSVTTLRATAPFTRIGAAVGIALMLAFGFAERAASQVVHRPGEYPKLRIVDPSKVRRQPPVAARIALKPFSFVGSKFEHGLNLVEEHKLHNRLQVMLNNPNIRPLIGGIGDGSGFGGGVAFSTVGVTARSWGFVGDFHVTGKRYVATNAGLRFTAAPANLGDVTLDILAGYNARPRESFFGTGADSGTQRTNFDLEERSTGAILELEPARRLRVGTQLKYSSTSISRGKDARFPSTDAVFPSSIVPGLRGDVELLESAVYAEFDARQGQSSPAKGFYLAAKLASVDGIGKGDFAYWRYSIDNRFYLPLGSERRVLAVRTLLHLTDTKNDGRVPFFRLARLGDSQTLRGYDTNRFYGKNAAAWNVEYRSALSNGLGAFAFTDFGQVFDRKADFNTRNFRVTYGGGFEVKSKKAVFLRAYVARSDERTRLMISFGPTF